MTTVTYDLSLDPEARKILERDTTVRSIDPDKIVTMAAVFDSIREQVESGWAGLSESDQQLLWKLSTGQHIDFGARRFTMPLIIFIQTLATIWDLVFHRRELFAMITAIGRLEDAVRKAVASDAWTDALSDDSFRSALEKGRHSLASDGKLNHVSFLDL
jgi:hypothetical protein